MQTSYDTGWSGCNHVERRYTCKDLKDIEGCPPCECTATSGRAKMDLGPAKKFLVCGKIGGWLLSRGVDISEIAGDNKIEE